MAICEQVESPFLAKGVVKREVVRITTPGTVIESTMLPEGENNYIGSVYLAEKGVGVCFADISTGEMQFAEFIDADPAKRLIDELSRFSPRELIGNPRRPRGWAAVGVYLPAAELRPGRLAGRGLPG